MLAPRTVIRAPGIVHLVAGRSSCSWPAVVCLSAPLVFVDRYTNTGRAGLVAVDQVLAGLVAMVRRPWSAVRRPGAMVRGPRALQRK